MLLIPCPICGPRPEAEFTYAGEAHIARPVDPGATDEAFWTDFLHNRSNPKGEHAERWRHTHGCARFFNAVRHTVSDRFVTSYKAGGKREGAGALDDAASLDAPPMQTPSERLGPA